MKRSIQLSVSSPCSQKWQDFAVTPAGGFCGSCNKTVVDFTRMSDNDIVQFFKSRPAHTCGRFAPGQLKEYPVWESEKVRPGRALFVAGLTSFFLILVSRPAQAQNLVEPQQVEAPLLTAQTVHLVSNDATGHVVRGTVISKDEDGLPLPGVNIVHQGTTEGTVTNADGWFEFPVRLKEGDVLIFSFIGFKTEEYKIPRTPDSEIVLNMSIMFELDVTLGEVAVSEPYTPKKGLGALWSKITRRF